MTYFKTVLIGLDKLGAAVFFNRDDVTISSLCRMVQLNDAGKLTAEQFGVLKLHPFQVKALRFIAKGLGVAHCEGARVNDIARSKSAAVLLDVVK